MTRHVACALALVLAACSNSAPASGEGTAPRTPEPAEADATPRDVALPERLDVWSAPETDTSAIDAFVDDAFVRPPIDAQPDAPAYVPPDAPPLDAPADEPISTPDAVTSRAIDAAGREDCLSWSITAPFDTFDFKGDMFTVLYDVRNECAQSFLFRVEHFNDFFPIAIHKDGAFWTYLGLCPGEGPEHDWSFRTVGEGITRGFTWRAETHQQLLEQCGATYEDGAAYTLVGYGSTPITSSDPWSTLYVLTEPIPITLRD